MIDSQPDPAGDTATDLVDSACKSHPKQYVLHHGDCLQVMPALPQVDCVITDPPYLTAAANVPIRGRGVSAPVVDSESIGMPWGYSLQWVDVVALLNPKHWIVYCNSYMLGGLITKLEQYTKLGTVFVWRKSNAPQMTRNVPRFDCEFIVWAKAYDATNVRARDFRSQVLDVPMPQAGCFATERETINGGQAAHPTQKPLKVVRPFVCNLTEPGATILDPFMGSGTTGVACMMEGRNFVGIELDAGYFEIAKRRIKDAAAQPRLTPDKAPTVQTVQRALVHGVI